MSRLSLSTVLAAIVLAVFAAPAAARDCPKSVGAPSAIVLEVSTGIVACERNADQERPVGSTMKLMTALLTLENADLDDTYRAPAYDAAPAESLIGLRQGDRLTVRDLLRGLLIRSGNDAAVTLAKGVAGSEQAFVQMMNQRARELDLDHTHYENPIGLDAPGAHSSARDLAMLALFLRTKPFFRRTVKQPDVTLVTGGVSKTFDNQNTLIPAVPWVNGVKTGHTTGAGDVLVGSGRQNGIQVISAVLDEPSKTARNEDTVRLLKFGMSKFQRITAAPTGTHVDVKVPIRYRRGAELELVVGFNGERTVVPRGGRKRVIVKPTSYPREVAGPIAAGAELGEADVLQDGRKIATVPLVASGEVPAAGVAQRTKSWFATPIGVLIAFVVVGGTVVLARRRRRPRGPGRKRAREEAGVA
ncbi:MAG TPA: D-alanyl-D-alanine carboxypeptidase family protein [Solirubrobacteraceae bacterium]|nr:D-alanyl-D-alanine carboxypeptidase family protein [Solirubrobacteraceae bacterium]